MKEYKYFPLVITAALLCCPENFARAKDIENTQYLNENIPQRAALLIGNFDYKNLTPLPGVEADLANMSQTFRDLGFDIVDTYSNVTTWEQFQYDVLKPFKSKIERDALVIAYFSGHGFTYGGYQYFAPTELPRSLREGKVSWNAITLETLPSVFADEGAGASIVIVDACRTIANFVIKDRNGNAIDKGPISPTGKSPSSNYILALSTKNGLPSIASADPKVMSVYTKALVNVLGSEAHKDFRRWHDDVEYEVIDQTEKQQVPGLHEFTMTDIVLKMSDEWRDGERAVWKSLVQAGKYKSIRKFATMKTLSPYIKEARKWLGDHSSDVASARTKVSPEGVDFAWQIGGNVEAISSAITFPQQAEFVEPDIGVQLAYYGLRANAGFSPPMPTASELDQWAKYVANSEDIETDEALEIFSQPASESVTIDQFQPGSPLNSTSQVSTDTQKILKIKEITRVPSLESVCTNTLGFQTCSVVEVTKLKEKIIEVPDRYWMPRTWVGVDASRNLRGWVPLDASNSQFDIPIGRPFEEIFLSQKENSPLGLVDPANLESSIKKAKLLGNKLSWASITTTTSSDLGIEEILVSTSIAALVELGIPSDKISSASGYDELPQNTVRVRLFVE